MSNQFLKLRRSAVPGRVPSTSSIDFGEIALNTYDGLAFIKRSGSMGEEVITLGSREGAFTGSFSGSFVGNGGGLFNIPASGIVGLNLSQIATGSVTASVSTGAGSFSLVSGSSTFLYVSSSGNVGIGTSTPTTTLDVNGTIRGSAGSSLANFTFNNGQLVYGGTSTSIVGFANQFFITNSLLAGLIQLQAQGAQGTIRFAAGSTNEVARFASTGNLLLNTTSDDTVNRLQVSGSSRFIGNMVVTGSTTITNGDLSVFKSSQPTINFQDQTGLNNSYQNASFGIWFNSPLAFLINVWGKTAVSVRSHNFSNVGYSTITLNSTPSNGFQSENGGHSLVIPLQATIARGLTFVRNDNTLNTYNHDAIRLSSATYGTYTFFRVDDIGNIYSRGSGIFGSETSFGSEALQVSGSARITNALVVTGSITSNTNVYSPLFQGPANVQLQYAGNNTYVRLEETGLVPNGILFNVNNTSNSFKFRHASNYSFTLGYNNTAGAAWFGNSTSLVVVNPSAQVQIDSITKGVLLPRMTEAQRLAISAPAQGLLVYDTGSATEGLWYYNSGSTPGWQEVLTNSGSQTISGSITANNITVTGTLTAQTIVAQTITSSTDYVSGSTIFGNSLSNTHQFTGSVSITGSLSLPYLSTGSVLFAGANGAISQDNSNLFWDDANNILGIGTNAPNTSAPLHVNKSQNTLTSLFVTNNNTGTAAHVGFRAGLDPTNFATDYISIAILGANWITAGNLKAKTGIIENYGSNLLISNYNNTEPISFATGTSRIEKLRLFNNGNLLLQNGGTFTDSGERLQVSGSSRFAGNMVITGSGATSATYAFTVQNSNGANTFRVRNDGPVFIEAVNTVATLYMSSNGDSSIQKSTSGTNGITLYGPASAHHTLTISSFNSDNYSNGALSSLRFPGNFISSTGNTAFSYMLLNGTINQTGTSTSITRGLYINPTITSASDFRAIEWSNNSVTAPSASWGLYGAGTAPNYINGNLLVGTTSNTGEKLNVGGAMNVTGNANVGSLSIASAATITSGNSTNTIISGYLLGTYTEIRGAVGGSSANLRLTGVNNAISSVFQVSAVSTVIANGFVTPLANTMLDVRGNTFVSGTLDILDAEINYQRNNNVTTGSARLIASIPTASLNAAFFDYVIVSGSNARAGTVTSVWVSSSVEWNETYTNDIGSTSDVTLYSAITGSSIGLFATSSINNVWTIKSLIRTI